MSKSPTFQPKGGFGLKERNREGQKNQAEYTEDPLIEVLRN